jgi:acetolactate synthase-1/2/3 large subunit
LKIKTPTHAGQAIVDSLALHGVNRVFAVPGESYLAVLDGLHGADIETVVCRQEGGAAYMAEAHGKFTGEPGVAMVTRGPGAANAYVAVHAAWQDATPMVLFVGLIPVADRQRESFQEFDPNAWFGTQAKRVFVLDEASRASEMVAEAFFAAKSGRPGPVIVGLPEDVITHRVRGRTAPPIAVAEGACLPRGAGADHHGPGSAKSLCIFVGGQRWTPEAAAAVTTFAEANGIPVIQDWRAADRIPFDSDGLNVGCPRLRPHPGHRTGSSPKPTCCLPSAQFPPTFPRTATPCASRHDADQHPGQHRHFTLRGRSGAVTSTYPCQPGSLRRPSRTPTGQGRTVERNGVPPAVQHRHDLSAHCRTYGSLPATREGTGHMSA